MDIETKNRGDDILVALKREKQAYADRGDTEREKQVAVAISAHGKTKKKKKPAGKPGPTETAAAEPTDAA